MIMTLINIELGQNDIDLVILGSCLLQKQKYPANSSRIWIGTDIFVKEIES